ncbi:MAG: hypothetical protein LW808_003665 [Verrucomicrobiota bacterium]|nr:MAG: hypothetical protein LW808_003665 [Verrucomicrobiota bacterium]
MSAVKTLCLAYQKQHNDSQAIVVRSHISLVRNFEAYRFPQKASQPERESVATFVTSKLRNSRFFDVYLDRSTLSPIEVEALQDLDLLGPVISSEKSSRHRKATRSSEQVLQKGYGIFCSTRQRCSVAINEENHVCIRTSMGGLQLENNWEHCTTLDDMLDDGSYVFSEQWGYLTANPNDVGTGMRASVFVHLPGLAMMEQIDHLAVALQQIGITLQRTGSAETSAPALFVISNAATLGIKESEELRRLKHVVETIVEQEQEARKDFLTIQDNRTLVCDWVGRMYGVLCSSYQISQEEALKLLAWMRFAVDLEMFDASYRSEIDWFLTSSQQGVLSVLESSDSLSEADDHVRAEYLKKVFRQFPEPKFLA